MAAPRKAARASTNATSIEVAPELTRLRAGVPHYIVAASRRGAEIKHLNVEVFNAGQHKATAVDVWMEVGAGLAFPLRGPRTLAAGQRGLYILRGGIPAPNGLRLRVLPDCTNCRR